MSENRRLGERWTERFARTSRPRAHGPLLTLAICSLLWAGPVAAEPGTPDRAAKDVVADTLAQVMEILDQSQLSAEVRRDRIAELAYEHFDFHTMSKLVVARPWRKFTKDQRSEFIASFKTHLARSYGRRLGRYDSTQVVEVVSAVTEPRGDVTVHSRVVGGQFDGAEMNYRMRGKTGEWLVIDVIIEGVSLVSNFRSQFKPILSQGGAVELLARLKDKNDALQVEIAVEDASEITGQPVSKSASAE